jgi:hypothetical protein
MGMQGGPSAEHFPCGPSISYYSGSSAFPDLPTPLNSQPYPRLRNPSSKSVNTNRECIERAFQPGSKYSNEARAQLLGLIRGSGFLLMNNLEPSIDSDEGQELVRKVAYLSGYPSIPSQLSSSSIFTLLVEFRERRCLMCGYVRTTLERAIGCVRSHLDHRPFACGGLSSGCLTCRGDSR